MNCIFSRIVGNILHGRWESQGRQYQFTDQVEVRNEAGDIIPLSDIQDGDEVQLSGQPATLITVRRSEQGIQEKAKQDADAKRNAELGKVPDTSSTHGTGKGRQFGPVTTPANPHPAPSPSSADLPHEGSHPFQQHGSTSQESADAKNKADAASTSEQAAAAKEAAQDATDDERRRKRGRS